MAHPTTTYEVTPMGQRTVRFNLNHLVSSLEFESDPDVEGVCLVVYEVTWPTVPDMIGVSYLYTNRTDAEHVAQEECAVPGQINERYVFGLK